MNLFPRYNRRRGTAWVLVLLAVLFMLPGFTVGQWQCEDGRACLSCAATSPEKQEICADDPGCRVAGLMASDCRACCRYVSNDAPTVDRTHKTVFADAPALLTVTFRFVPLCLLESIEAGFPDASASPPRLSLSGCDSPRAPPAGC